MEDKIIQQIKALFAGVDERDWPKTESTMNNSVLLDYSSMTGNPPVSLAPKDITKSWAAFLSGFDRTHHSLSAFSVKMNEGNAEVHFDGKADHFLGAEVWTVQGSYDAKLKLNNNSWRVFEFKFNFTEQTGNTNLPGIVAQRLQK